jgi:hypothetical protein
MYLLICDECGEPATRSICGMNGRVLIDGKDNNLQAADFCEAHAPREGRHQPHNCQRVRFEWVGKEAWNHE